MSAERRREPRLPARGAVWVRESTEGAQRLAGELVDRSRQGFRAAFESVGPPSGASVEFELEDCRGIAIAMWTRRLGARIECGFLIEA